MLRFNRHEIGISTGEAVVVSDFDENGPMWTGQGDRVSRCPVRFDESYLTPPTVHLSPSMWDLDVGTNQRGDLSAENVTSSGFDIVFRTWGDTRVARLRVRWMALGAVPDEDDFVL